MNVSPTPMSTRPGNPGAGDRRRDREPAIDPGPERDASAGGSFYRLRSLQRTRPGGRTGIQPRLHCRRKRDLAYLRWLRDPRTDAGDARPARCGNPALEATRRSVASDVRSAFLDLQQADRVLESETRNVQNADESLEIAKGNLGAGLGTQLDILQAASDVTRTRTTRLGAIYLHNVALARLARASAREPEALGLRRERWRNRRPRENRFVEVAAPPSTLGGDRTMKRDLLSVSAQLVAIRARSRLRCAICFANGDHASTLPIRRSLRQTRWNA